MSIQWEYSFGDRPAVTEGFALRRPPTPMSAADGVGAAAAPVTVTTTATPVAPAGTVSPSARPGFLVAVDNAGAGTAVQIQWSSDPAFPAPAATASAPAAAGQSDARTLVAASSDLADGVWWWRARIVGTYGAGAWSDPVQFAVNAGEGAAALGGSWTVDDRAGPATHLWYIDHTRTGDDSGAPGVLVGTGFGAAPQVLLGDLPCAVTAVDIVADSAGAGAQRIEPGTVCTPWHQTVTFTIPGVGPDHDGDALTVIGGN